MSDVIYEAARERELRAYRPRRGARAPGRASSS